MRMRVKVASKTKCNSHPTPKDLLTAEQLKELREGDVVEVWWEDPTDEERSMWCDGKVMKATS